MGLKPIVYTDDSMHVQCKVVASALHAKSIFLDDLDQAGLVLNVPISLLEHMQCGRWLGFLIDLLKGTFQVPQDPIQKLHEYLQQVPFREPVRVCFIASIVGQRAITFDL